MTNGNHKVDLDADASEGGSFDLEQMWFVVREKAWLIALCGLIGILAGLAYIHRTSLTYFSQAVIEVDAEQVKSVDYEGTKESMDPLSDEMAQTMLAIFHSRAFAEEVITDNGLLKNPEFVLLPPGSPPLTMDQGIGAISGMTKVSIRPGTRFIEVGVTHPNPMMARDLANMLATAYIHHLQVQREQAGNAIIHGLKDQVTEASSNLSQCETDLQQYVKSHDAGSLVEAHDTIVADLKTKSGEVSAAHGNRVQLETDDEEVQNHLHDPDALLLIPSVANHPSITAVREAIKADEEDIASLRMWYTDKHPKMIQAHLKLAEDQKTLQDNLEKIPQVIHAAREAAMDLEARLEPELQAQEQLAEKLGDDQIQYDVLNRQVETDRALYDGLLARLKQATVANGYESAGMHIFEPAQAPTDAMQARKSRTLGISLGGGLMLGLVLSFGLNMLDSSVKTVDQAEDVLGLTVLASIPRQGSSRIKESGLAMMKAPGSPIAEAFRSLRTAVYLAGKTKGRKVVLFTSTLAGEGKTFCSTNYAIALAQQGLRTLLIDADLRSPMVCTVLLGNKKLIGLGELLSRKINASEAIHETGIENLWVMPSGALLPNPAELLARSDMSEIMRDLGERFERIVIDTAPVTAVSDTLLLLEHAQAICLVAHAGKTARKWILRALKLIAEAGSRPAGVILNQMSMRMANAYSYYPGKYGEPEVYGANGTYVEREKKEEVEVVEGQPRF